LSLLANREAAAVTAVEAAVAVVSEIEIIAE
jgi:hypothetical protein